MGKNLFTKLNEARVELQEMNLKKSGENTFAGFKYYELADFLPQINKLMKEKGLFSAITFEHDYAILRIYDCDNMEQFIEFKSPMRDIQQKGCNEIQALGSVETYSRRYLYLTAFEIVESDFSDAVSGQDDKNNKPQQPAKITQGTINQIKLMAECYAQILDGKSTEDVIAVIYDKFKIDKFENLTDAQGQTVVKTVNEWINKQKKKNAEQTA